MLKLILHFRWRFQDEAEPAGLVSLSRARFSQRKSLSALASSRPLSLILSCQYLSRWKVIEPSNGEGKEGGWKDYLRASSTELYSCFTLAVFFSSFTFWQTFSLNRKHGKAIGELFSPAGNLLNKFTLGFGRWKVGERSLSMNKSFYDRQHNQPTHLFHRRTLFLTLNFLMNVDFQQEWEWQPKYWDLIPFTQFSIPTSWAADLLTNWVIIDSTSLHPHGSSWFIGLSKLI